MNTKIIQSALALRRELSAANLTRRELFKLGLLSGSGAFLSLNGLRALGASGSDVESPPTTPWQEQLPRFAVEPPVGALNPPPNPAAHQYYALYPPKKLYSLRANEVMHTFHPELPQSPIWRYDGTSPGPVIHARYGEPILVRIANGLPLNHVGFGVPQLTTHLHNFHTAPESDGGPWDWYPANLPATNGGYKDHHYLLARAGFSIPGPHEYTGDPLESLHTLFFHYHRPDFTGAGVYKGLIGFFLIFDENDTGNEGTGWRLPSGEYDFPIFIADKQFDPDSGQLIFDQFNTDGFLSDKLTANGKIQPFLNVKRRKYRFRLLNGGPARFYTFVLRKGGSNRPFTQITDNGNFLQAPRRNLTKIEVQVAERPDIIVDFSQFQAGDKVYLANILPMKDGRGPDRGKTLNPDDVANQIIEFRVESYSGTDGSQIPNYFRDLPPIPDLSNVPRRSWRFERGNGMWQINGKIFDPEEDHLPVSLANPKNPVKRNSAEVWVLQNNSGGWEHPVHIHFEEAQVIKVNGKTVPLGQRSRVDMYRLARNTKLELFMRFRDFPDPDFSAPTPSEAGRYVMHCHNITHEDNAMMVTWNVVPE